jgi:hypothetical protein
MKLLTCLQTGESNDHSFSKVGLKALAFQIVGQIFFKMSKSLIHNAHLGKIPSFCKILDLKIKKIMATNFVYYLPL